MGAAEQNQYPGQNQYQYRPAGTNTNTNTGIGIGLGIGIDTRPTTHHLNVAGSPNSKLRSTIYFESLEFLRNEDFLSPG